MAQNEELRTARLGYYVSGRMKMVIDDGEEMEVGPGDFAIDGAAGA
jgi:hypothetical protein